MSALVIWIDREHAKLFQFSEEKMERKNLKSHHTDHHTHPFDQLDIKRQEHEFHSEIATHLNDCERILIVGPGVAKNHFQNFLTEHFPALARKVAGCETLDHPTDPQIAALARKFFSAAAPRAS